MEQEVDELKLKIKEVEQSIESLIIMMQRDPHNAQLPTLEQRLTAREQRLATLEERLTERQKRKTQLEQEQQLMREEGAKRVQAPNRSAAALFFAWHVLNPSSELGAAPCRCPALVPL